MPIAPKTHRSKSIPKHEDMRGNSAERGYNWRWRHASKVYLSVHPLCAECQRHGKVTGATVVDHVVPHRGDDELFWRESNWQAMCKACHDVKTARGE